MEPGIIGYEVKYMSWRGKFVHTCAHELGWYIEQVKQEMDKEWSRRSDRQIVTRGSMTSQTVGSLLMLGGFSVNIGNTCQ